MHAWLGYETRGGTLSGRPRAPCVPDSDSVFILALFIEISIRFPPAFMSAWLLGGGVVVVVEVCSTRSDQCIHGGFGTVHRRPIGLGCVKRRAFPAS